MDFFFFFSWEVSLFVLPEMWYLAFLLCSWPMIKTIKLDCHLRGVIIRWVHCSLPQDYIIFYTVPNLHQLLFIGQLIILGWTSFKIASILHEIDRTRCSKHSSKVNIDMMLRICYRFVSCTSLVSILCSTTSQRFIIIIIIIKKPVEAG